VLEATVRNPSLQIPRKEVMEIRVLREGDQAMLVKKKPATETAKVIRTITLVRILVLSIVCLLSTLIPYYEKEGVTNLRKSRLFTIWRSKFAGRFCERKNSIY
jgi:hypothetical protein